MNTLPLSRMRVFTTFFVGALLWMLGPFNTQAAEVELLSNGGFESGNTSWSRNNDSGIVQLSYPRRGTWYGYLGNVNDAIGSIHQFIDIPANATSATLTFYLNVVTYETGVNTTFDKMDVNFRHATSDALLKKWKTYSESDKGNNTAGQYTLKTISLNSEDLLPYKDKTVLLQFYGTTDYADSTIFRIDDVSFLVTTADTPEPPSFFETVGYNDRIELGWADNSSDESGFRIDRKVNDGGFSQLATVEANVTLYTDNAVSRCDVYTYRVRAYNSSGNSDYADESANFLRPAAPSHLIATSTASAINLRWQDNACDEDSIIVERRVGTTGSWDQFASFVPNTVGTTDNSAALGVTYYYRVYAHNASGNSAYSGEVSAKRSRTFTVGVSAGPNGGVTPSGNVSVSEGSNLDLLAAPLNTYVVDNWLLDGVAVQPGGNTYTLSAVSADHTISVTFRLATFRLEIGGSLDDVLVFLDGRQVLAVAVYNLTHGTQVTVRKYVNSLSQFVDYWSVVTQSGSQTIPGMAVTTVLLSDTVLQAILGTRSSNPRTGGTFSGGTPVINVPPSGTTSPEVTRTVQHSHDLVCWHDYDLDPTSPQVVVNGGACSFGELAEDTAFFRTLLDVKVHAEPILLFPIPGRSATTVRVSALLDHCNEDPLTRFSADSPPNNNWYANGLIGGSIHKDKMFMTYKGETLCEGNSVVEKVPGINPDFNLWQFTKTTALSRPLEFNWDYEGNSAISYSGHPGYDFAVSDILDNNGQIAENVIVVACEAGTVIPNQSGSYENRVFVEHEHLGLATAYLHMKKWSKRIFERNDTASDSKMFYYAKSVRVEKGEILGLVGGAGKQDDKMNLTAFGRHLHVELYRIVQREGRKYYVLMDPYGAYTETGKHKYGTSWLPSVTPAKAYEAADYSP